MGAMKPIDEVRNCIDRLCRRMTSQEYAEFLEEIASEVEIREMAVKEEMEHDEEDG